MSAHRLTQGGLIDRDKPLRFSFDGKNYSGFAGDTLASALLANDVTLMGRSFKYHRPRGVLSAGSEEPNALVELREGAYREPNTRATVAELFEGMAANSQNRFPSLKYDLLSVNSKLSPFFAAGFYYKTFMWPASFWEKIYEPMIRRAAGLGRNAGVPDPDIYEKSTNFAMSSSSAAARRALRRRWRPGGQGGALSFAMRILCSAGRGFRKAKPSTWRNWRLAENITVLTRTTVFGVYDGGTYGAIERLTDHLSRLRRSRASGLLKSSPRAACWRAVRSSGRCCLARTICPA